MMKCKFCGQKLPASSKFCFQCGKQQPFDEQVEMKSERLLFKSEGNPVKRMKVLYICSVILIVCGIILMICAYQLGRRTQNIMWMGIGAIVLGVLFLAVTSFNSANKARLYIFDNHIEGVQVTPLKTFYLKYEDIRDIQKNSVFGCDMITFRDSRDTYVVFTNELNIAYNILCDKVYGEV